MSGDPVNLGIVRAQYGENDAKLWPHENSVPAHLANPLNAYEQEVQRLLRESTSAAEFLPKVYAISPPADQRRTLLTMMKMDGRRLKAQQGMTSSEVRDCKMRFMFNWADRVNKKIGVPIPWIKQWLKDVGVRDATGHLAVEFGGDP